MALRSLLFVPGDRPERFDKAAASGADAVILDLEDAVSMSRKPIARDAVAQYLSTRRDDSRLFVRINPLDTAASGSDLAALQGKMPDGIVLPKARGSASVRSLTLKLDERGMAGVRVLPISPETPGAVFRLEEFCDVADDLIGLTWGAEDLATSTGSHANREEDGAYTSPYVVARALMLFAAAACDIPAIDTVYPDFADLDGLAAYARRSARDGFTGMLAIHPAQVAVINAAFSVSEAEVARARAVIAAFDDQAGAGVIQVEGRMLDRPHLELAKRLLRRAGLSDPVA